MIKYSVVIRTTGNAKEKYQKLLNSIDKLVPKPEEVIVVLPEGYEKPLEKLGWETYYFCQKGMVEQRLYGINKCKTPYALVCDDDVCFDENFVQKLHSPIEEGIAQLSAGPLLSYLPPKGVKSVFYTFTGAAIPRVISGGKYITVLPTTGYTYYRSIDVERHEYYKAESLPWTCFYGSIESMKEIHMEDEMWLQLHGYASMDDQTMFYKAHLLGIETAVVSDATYEHLDAQTSRKILEDIAYAMEFNRYIFWHRFIYNLDSGIKRKFDKLCIEYYFGIKFFYNLLRLCKGSLDMNAFNAKLQAVKDAKEFVKSEQYQKLKPLCRKDKMRM